MRRRPHLGAPVCGQNEGATASRKPASGALRQVRTASSPSATSTSAGAPPSPSSGGPRSPPGSTPPNEPSPTPTRLSGTRQSGKPPRSSKRPTARSRVAEWYWELVTDDLLDGLPPTALAAVRQVAEELTVRESM